MQQWIGCDAHKKFSVFVAVDERGKAGHAVRVEHKREVFRTYLESLPANSEIAIESMGSWYWLVDEMERAQHIPHLTNPLEAKKRMGKPNKTDRLDARGLGVLLRNGTLPECWIPPGELRDQRELLRTRMALRDMRIKLKLRIHAALDRYGLQAEGISDLFGKSGRVYLAEAAAELPTETRRMVVTQLEALDELTEKIEAVEKRIQEQIAPSAEVKLLLSIPGVGAILAPVIWLEIGDVNRFPRAEQLASYAGLVPRVISSGERMRLGNVSKSVNQYLKWAFVEAATCAVTVQHCYHVHSSEHHVPPSEREAEIRRNRAPN